MKKLYTLALALSCSAAVMAAGPVFQLKPMPEAGHSAKVVSMKRYSNFDTERSSLSPMADDAVGIAGIYTVSIDDSYLQSGAGKYEAKAVVTETNGTVTIQCDEFVSDLTASYDASTGKLSFTKVKLGSNGTHYLRVEPFTGLNEAKTDFLYANFDATFNSETGAIEFPESHGFAWVAYQNAFYSTKVGFYAAFGIEGLVAGFDEPEFDEVQEGQWKSAGTAKLEDAWITPSYKFQTGEQLVPSEHSINAEIQQNVDNPNLFRLWRPFHDTEWTLVGNNTSAFDGQIVFDITDPEHVHVKCGMPAGFKNSNGEFFVFGFLGYYIHGMGENWNDSLLPQLYALMESKNAPFDTYADGVVTINNSVFDVKYTCNSALSWKENEYVVSKIHLPADLAAAQAPIVDNENAPVEYFNLQGVKIQNPESGQVVIRRQGADVRKVFVK